MNSQYPNTGGFMGNDEPSPYSRRERRQQSQLTPLTPPVDPYAAYGINPYGEDGRPLPHAPREQEWNTLAIVGFITSLLCMAPIAIILGIVSLTQIRQTGEKGRGLAIASIVLGVNAIIMFAMLVYVLLVIAPGWTTLV